MGEKTAMPIKAFGGINKLHTRELGQASEGKNFWTRNGALMTREGCSLYASPPITTRIRSVHSAVKPKITPRLLVEEWPSANSLGKLWRYNSIDWSCLLSDVSGNGFRSVMYNNYLILVNGPQQYAYDVELDAISKLYNSEGGEVPWMDFVTVHKDILFGGGHTSAYADTIYFNGYEKDSSGKILGRSINSWPPDFAIKIPDPTGASVLICISAGSHLVILTEYSYWLLYGDNEDNFSLIPGGAIGTYDKDCVAKVGDYVIWLGRDEFKVFRVYAYSGTEPVVISQPIEELLNNLPKTASAEARAYGFGTKFWLVLPDINANTTKAFVYDIEEKQWYYHEFPAAFTSACLHDGEVYFGTNDTRIVKLGSDTTDFGNPITTEFKIGPIHLDGANKFKIKRIWINAEPRNNFSLNVYSSTDAEAESGPYSVSFEAGGQKTQQVKLQGGNKGRDVYLRVVTTDKINELQSFSLTVVPKAVK